MIYANAAPVNLPLTSTVQPGWLRLFVNVNIHPLYIFDNVFLQSSNSMSNSPLSHLIHGNFRFWPCNAFLCFRNTSLDAYTFPQMSHSAFCGFGLTFFDSSSGCVNLNGQQPITQNRSNRANATHPTPSNNTTDWPSPPSWICCNTQSNEFIGVSSAFSGLCLLFSCDFRIDDVRKVCSQ